MDKAGCVRIGWRRRCETDRVHASCARRSATSIPAPRDPIDEIAALPANAARGCTSMRRSASGPPRANRGGRWSPASSASIPSRQMRHKWLVPYDSGLVFTAHPEAHQQSLVMPAHYIQMTPGEREPRSFTPDESRRARGLPLYAALRALGR